MDFHIVVTGRECVKFVENKVRRFNSVGITIFIDGKDDAGAAIRACSGRIGDEYFHIARCHTAQMFGCFRVECVGMLVQQVSQRLRRHQFQNDDGEIFDKSFFVFRQVRHHFGREIVHQLRIAVGRIGDEIE